MKDREIKEKLAALVKVEELRREIIELRREIRLERTAHTHCCCSHHYHPPVYQYTYPYRVEWGTSTISGEELTNSTIVTQ